MPPSARLFGTDREEIVDLDSWFAHAPPEKGAAQWKDGYSAKEQARAWLRSGRPMVPEELWSAIAELAGDVDEIYGRPEHPTRLDNYPRARHHDLFACPRRNGATLIVLGVEAKACESFDWTVSDRATAAAPSKGERDATCSPARCSGATCSTSIPAISSIQAWATTVISCGPRRSAP
jgi:hypothetical protein